MLCATDTVRDDAVAYATDAIAGNADNAIAYISAFCKPDVTHNGAIN